MKLFRVLQLVVLLANCVFAGWVFHSYGMPVLKLHHWPLTVMQTKLVLIAGAFLPVSLLCLWVPVSAAVVQFACAFIGSTLRSGTPMPALHQVAREIMMAAGAVIIVSVIHSITGITQEAFEEPGSDSH
jgi:hypothetical protein